jgi:hypothetical protein
MSKQDKDMTGQKFGRLTFIRPTERFSNKEEVIWELKCDCGNTHFSPPSYITNTRRPTLNCGCVRREKTANTIDDFWANIRIREPEECWEWQASTVGEGYGSFSWESKNVYAHRFAWSLVNGPIPSGMFICHKCDNRLCCNPNHLFLGTQQDNMQDKMNKGRAPAGENHVSAKLTEEQVAIIRSEYATGTVLQKDLAKRYNVGTQQISKICRGESWRPR